MLKERIIQLQIALFFDNLEKRPDKLMDKVDDILGNIFDQMPTIIPIPDDAPPEVPSVISESKNGLYRCNVARSRIDFTMNFLNSNDSASVQLESFMEKIKPLAALVFGLKTITRFGVVGQYLIQDGDPVKRIQSKLLKKDLGDLEELQIRYNKRFQDKYLEINDIIDINKANVLQNNRETSGIVIQRDMNNVPIKSLNIDDFESIITSKKDSFRLSSIVKLV